MEIADWVVVLGCGVTRDGVPSAALQRRVATAAAAWHRGLAPKVLLTGGRRWWGHAEAVVMRRALLELGVDEKAVQLELCSLTTRENAFYCRRLVHPEPARGTTVAGPTIALVSCDWHLPRALGHFRRAGFRCLPCPAPAPRRGFSPMRWLGEHVRSLSAALTDGPALGPAGREP